MSRVIAAPLLLLLVLLLSPFSSTSSSLPSPSPLPSPTAPTPTVEPSGPRWMHLDREYLNDLLPWQITFPGSHDTGSYSLIERVSDNTPQFLRSVLRDFEDLGIERPLEIVRSFAVSQKSSVYDQLMAGARYLDLRAIWDKKDMVYRTLHFLLGTEFEILLKDIQRFNDEYPSELIFIKFRIELETPETVDEIVELLYKYLGHRLCPPGKKGFDRTYSEMVANNQTIAVYFDDKYLSTSPLKAYFFDGVPQYRWANTDSLSYLTENQVEAMGDLCDEPDVQCELQWLLTSTEKLIIESVLDLNKIHSLHELSRVCNAIYVPFLESHPYRPNLLLVDWFEETPVVEIARQRNRSPCRDISKFAGPDGLCTKWAPTGLCSTNATIAEWCPLSCRLCPVLSGQAGSKCTSNSDCYYGICAQEICLVQTPKPLGHPCGVNMQCLSAKCSKFECVAS